MLHIETSNDHGNDWQVWLEGQEESGCYGYGKTRQEAIEDYVFRQDESFKKQITALGYHYMMCFDPLIKNWYCSILGLHNHDRIIGSGKTEDDALLQAALKMVRS